MAHANMISMELQTFIDTAFEKLKQEIAEAFAELQHQQKLAQQQAAA
jgi:hypothetical protein